MADKGFIRTLTASIPDQTTRRVVQQSFEHVLDNMRLGVPEHQTRAVNSQQYWLVGTTSTSANTEFSLEHGLPSAPRYLIPTLDLSQPGAKIVPLTVTRAADARRIYLSSSDTNASITVLVE